MTMEFLTYLLLLLVFFLVPFCLLCVFLLLPCGERFKRWSIRLLFHPFITRGNNFDDDDDDDDDDTFDVEDDDVDDYERHPTFWFDYRQIRVRQRQSRRNRFDADSVDDRVGGGGRGVAAGAASVEVGAGGVLLNGKMNNHVVKQNGGTEMKTMTSTPTTTTAKPTLNATTTTTSSTTSSKRKQKENGFCSCLSPWTLLAVCACLIYSLSAFTFFRLWIFQVKNGNDLARGGGGEGWNCFRGMDMVNLRSSGGMSHCHSTDSSDCVDCT